jgi:hypothetical protein
MFDNLRDLSDAPLYEDDEQQASSNKGPQTADMPAPAAPVRKTRKSRNFLGMTAQQRFLISVMLMFTVCLLGTLVMFVTGRMSIF